MNPSERKLYEMVSAWESSVSDPRDAYPFRALLDELLFHGRLRYDDYLQFRSDGVFSVRLLKWLENTSTSRDRKIMLRLLAHLVFVDSGQFLALYRDAYRRIILPWLVGSEWGAEDHLNHDYLLRIREKLLHFPFFSITESFDGVDFFKANDLAGLPKLQILGEKPNAIHSHLPSAEVDGLIILEDFVGTGKQAARILRVVTDLAPPHWRLLFVPLIALENGLKSSLLKMKAHNLTISPVQILSSRLCIPETPLKSESIDFPSARSLIKKTARRVLSPFNEYDDAPSDPFGYKGCGAIFVTSHNSPNNTLPLVHHRAPEWEPLFRRLHHAKGDL